jgi:hypothetical protein
MKISLAVISGLALLAVGTADAKKAPGSSNYVVVVGWDAQNNKLTYRESKSGSDATELHVKHMKSIEWQPEHANSQTLAFDFSSNSDSPFVEGQSRTGRGTAFIPRNLRKLRDGENSTRYKYSVTLTDNGTAHSEDPIIIIEQ